MKTIFTSLILLFAMSCIAVSQDTISAEIYGANNVIVWHKHITANCDAVFVVDVTTEGNHFIINEFDRTTSWAMCDCVFDLSTTFTALAPGDYEADIYRNKMKPYFDKDTTYFEGSVSFHIDIGPLPISKIDSKQSKCLGSPYVGIKDSKQNYMPAQVYPNPVKSGFHISFYADKTCSGILKGYNLYGNEVYASEKIEVMEGNNNIPVEAYVLTPGVYYFKLYLGNNIIFLPRLVVVR